MFKLTVYQSPLLLCQIKDIPIKGIKKINVILVCLIDISLLSFFMQFDFESAKLSNCFHFPLGNYLHVDFLLKYV